jgi:hypothetical protein
MLPVANTVADHWGARRLHPHVSESDLQKSLFGGGVEFP